MIILNGNEIQHTRPTAVTIGFFDGVHLGHCDLLRQLCSLASERGLLPAAVTFPESPRTVLSGGEKRQRLLTTVEEKRDALSETGIHFCIELPFTRELSLMNARDFMLRYLKERYGAALLVVGYNHRFGHDREADFSKYAEAGKEAGIEVLQARRYVSREGLSVSSTLIRGLLDQGDVEAATACLGRHYTLGGTVVQGKQLGRRLGFPTANLRPDTKDKLIPMNGVYAVKAHVGENVYGGMLNIGSRPTVDGAGSTSIETHLFRFDGNLYGRQIELELIYRMRDEYKFSSLDALKQQLGRDARSAQRFLQNKP